MGWDGWDWDTVSSVIEEYLKAPLEEFKCLRCFDKLDIWERNIFFEIKTHFSYFNVLGIASSLRKRQRQIIRLSKLSWKWSVGIWHHHLVQQMLKNCSLMEGWWQPTTDLPYQEKSWTRFSFCEKTHWWQTSILAGYKKTFICIWTTKTINVWSKNKMIIRLSF